MGIFVDDKLILMSLCQIYTCNIESDHGGEQAKQNPHFLEMFFFKPSLILPPPPPPQLKDRSAHELQCLVKISRYGKICPR